MGNIFRSVEYLSNYARGAHRNARRSLCTYLWLYSPLLGLGQFFSFLIFYTVDRTPSTGDQPIAKPLPAHRTTGQHKHRINAHRHSCLKWDSNARSQSLSGRRRFMPQTAPPLRSTGLYVYRSLLISGCSLNGSMLTNVRKTTQ
jgi:hypothetical protein